ncbi:MAG: EAL domain-containing protein, partial [Thermomicrobium sp.]
GWYTIGPHGRTGSKAQLVALRMSGWVIKNVQLNSCTTDHAQALHTFEMILERHALLTGGVVLELTETLAITDFAELRAQLQRLRNGDCLLAVDGFGVGYSSLHQLRSFPVDFLKIDGRFVVDLLNDPVDCSIVRVLVKLARAWGAETIVEWVERESRLNQLCVLDIDDAQGSAIGRPQLVAEF